jgi:hypothetical protein
LGSFDLVGFSGVGFTRPGRIQRGWVHSTWSGSAGLGSLDLVGFGGAGFSGAGALDLVGFGGAGFKRGLDLATLVRTSEAATPFRRIQNSSTWSGSARGSAGFGTSEEATMTHRAPAGAPPSSPADERGPHFRRRAGGCNELLNPGSGEDTPASDARHPTPSSRCGVAGRTTASASSTARGPSRRADGTQIATRSEHALDCQATRPHRAVAPRRTARIKQLAKLRAHRVVSHAELTQTIL